MNRIISSLLVVAALAVPAVAAADVHVYPRINQAATDHNDSNNYASLDITGVRPDGEHTFSYRITSDAPDRDSRTFETCQRHAALVLAKPGRYELDVRFSPVRSATYGFLTGCTLRRVEPEAGQ